MKRLNEMIQLMYIIPAVCMKTHSFFFYISMNISIYFYMSEHQCESDITIMETANSTSDLFFLAK